MGFRWLSFFCLSVFSLVTACQGAGTSIDEATPSMGLNENESVATHEERLSAGAPIIEFFNQSETIIDTIRPVRLWWKVQNAVRVDVWDGFRNTVYPLLGNDSYIEVWPERTATYRLTACNEQNVCVSREVVIQWAPLAVDYFMASTQILNRPDTLQLRWKTRGATRVDIVDGMTNATLENVGIEGVRDFFTDRTATYTLLARGGDGSVQTRTVTVVVNRTDVAVIRNFDVYPPVLQFPGTVQVYWAVDYATNVEIVDGFSGRTYTQLPGQSMIRLFIGRSSTLTLRAFGQNGAVEFREAHVTVVNER